LAQRSAMSWLSSLQDGLKNAEALLNAVDQSVKETVESVGGGEDGDGGAPAKAKPSFEAEKRQAGEARSSASGNNVREKRAARPGPAGSRLPTAPATTASAAKVPLASPSTVRKPVAGRKPTQARAVERKGRDAGATAAARKARAKAGQDAPAPSQGKGVASESGAGLGTALPAPPPAPEAKPAEPAAGPAVVERKTFDDLTAAMEAPKGTSAAPAEDVAAAVDISQGEDSQESREFPAFPSPPKQEEAPAPAEVEAEAKSPVDEPAEPSLGGTSDGEQVTASVRPKSELKDEKAVSGSNQSDSEGKEGVMNGVAAAGGPAKAKAKAVWSQIGASVDAMSEARAQMREKLEKEIEEATSLSKERSSATSGAGKGAAGAPASSASSAASQKEARLSAMCERLSNRLQQYKMENEQLEELLREAERSKEDSDKVAGAVEEQKRVLAGKDAEIEELKLRLEEALMAKEIGKEELLSLKGQHDELAKEMSNSEIRVLEAAREELNALELRFETERKAHKATKDAALKREQDLEAHVAENTTALATMQHSLDERSERVASLEEANASLEHDYSQLVKELSDKQAQQQQLSARAQKSESLARALKQAVQEMEKKVDAAQGESKSAREKILELESELKSAQNEEANDAKGADSGGKNVQQKLNEMTDLLYLKQAQLEKLASDKAAVQMSLEKEVGVLKQELQQVKTINTMSSRRSPVYDIEEVVPIETIPMYDRLAKNRRVGNYIRRGAQALDFSTSTVVGLLKQQPVVRIGLFVYILSIHFFLYFMLARLQSKSIRMEEVIRHHSDPNTRSSLLG